MNGQEEFNVATVELGNSRLIEASAGTGKTYSVAILVLRLILEKQIPIEKILMVTFTNAAVAELESRVRKFVRHAYSYISGNELNDDVIREVVGEPNTDKTKLLRKAMLSLDSISVLTIHGFCQQVIDNFTFETDQSFDYEVIADDMNLLTDESNKYFREVINVLDDESLTLINKTDTITSIRENMPQLLKKHLQGMIFIDSELDETANPEELKKDIELKREAFKNFVSEKLIQVREMDMGKNALYKDALNNNAEEFIRRFRNQLIKPAGYFSQFEFMEDDFRRLDEERAKAEKEFVNYFYLDFFKQARQNIRQLKQDLGYISYDDQIKTVHSALANTFFREKLSEKYDAVFIDEFQDTDNYQYEIFSKVFGERAQNAPIIFYIGDPKQSIYGWRGADLDTYKRAKSETDNSILTMNKNYRSTEDMINALNTLLDPGEDFNMFDDEEIKYHKVDKGYGGANVGEMTDNGSKIKPVTVWDFGKIDDGINYRKVASEICRILKDDVSIGNRKIRPGDIGVLVRSNKEGNKIKQELARLNIPAVKRDSTKVFETPEFMLVRYLILAVLSPSRGRINRILYSPYFGFNITDIKRLDDEKHIQIFLDLRKVLRVEGIYNMISAFLNKYNVRSICMADMTGQRILANIHQIAEIMHVIERKHKLMPEELILWMQRISSENNEEYEMRLESDEDAVQISTIHKAKGLEYNIVFAPGLSMTPVKRFLGDGYINDFRKEGKHYFTLSYNSLSPEDKNTFTRQKEQENRRLIYVALTRAVHKSYISRLAKSVTSSLDKILEKYQDNSDLIEIIDLIEDPAIMNDCRFDPDDTLEEFSPRPKPGIEVKNTFGIHSFSALSRAHYTAPFEKAVLGDHENYDQFVFQDLGRGAKVGTALHSIFERLDFSANEESWRKTIMDAAKYYPNIIQTGEDENGNQGNYEMIYSMVSQVMNTPISFIDPGFSLASVTNENKLPEMEFYFSVDKVNKTIINKMLSEDTQLSGEADLEGLMTGFIDLVFIHNGKYYILDWKSNHLGNSTDDYDFEGMEAAMTGSNYHLQYKIYTVALHRWLEKNINEYDYNKHFGGVIYIFLRGVREGLDTGIFTKKVDKNEILSLDKGLRGGL